jgi:hypothetical protein
MIYVEIVANRWEFDGTGNSKVVGIRRRSVTERDAVM